MSQHVLNIMDKQTLYSCQVACFAESFDFEQLTEALLSTGQAACYRDVLYLEMEQGSCVFFPFGVAVFWNLRKEMIDRLSVEIEQYLKVALDEPEADHFSYLVGCEKNRFTHTRVELTDDEPLTLMAISHALAQSTKLSVFESQAQTTIEKTSIIPRKLALTGSTSLSRNEAAKMRGQLFLTKSEILLKYELLDTPEFFWEYPELQSIYEVGASYLELKQRTELLTLKLATIHEMFEMLADDLKHQHSSKLEWIIIWLIAVEIVIFLVNDFILAH